MLEGRHVVSLQTLEDPAVGGWSIQPALYIPVCGFDSDNLCSGTGEVRAWISVAAAMKRPARVIDYIPAHRTKTGCGFIGWPEANAGEK